MQQSFHALARGVEIELQREIAPQVAELGELDQAAAHALQGRLDEFEVMQAPADDRHLGVGAQDLERALEKRFEVAETEAGIGVAQPAIILEQLPLRLLAEEASHAAVAEERGDVVGVGAAAEVLIIDQIKLAI